MYLHTLELTWKDWVGFDYGKRIVKDIKYGENKINRGRPHIGLQWKYEARCKVSIFLMSEHMSR